jgi:hypothetical protein
MSTFNHNDKFFITSGGNVVINGQSTDGYFEIRQTDNTPSIRLNNGSNPNGAYYDILSNTAGSLVLNRNGSLLTTLSDTSGNATFGGTVRAEDRFDLYDGSYVFQLRNSSGAFDIRNGNSGEIPLAIDSSSNATFEGDVIAANRLLRIRNTTNDATGINNVVNYLYFDATDDNDNNRSTGLIQTTSESAFSSSVLATIDSSMQFFVSENNFLVKWLDVASDKTATFAGSLHLDSDSAQLQFGDDNDMQMFHNGANGKITNGTGGLYLGSDTAIGFQSANHGTNYLTLTSSSATFTGQVKTTSNSGFFVDGTVDMSMSYYQNVPSTSWGIFTSNNHADTVISTNLRIDGNHDLITNQTHSTVKGSGIVFTGNQHHAGAGAIAMYALGNGSATAGTVTAEENYSLLIDNTSATFAGTIKPLQGMESAYGVYTDGGTYTNQWQKVLSIPYASNMFGYSGIVLSIMQIGATNGAGAHADIHIHYKFQSNNGRLNANIINYGETEIDADHIAIRRDHSNLRIELYHKVTTSYTSPRYLLKHNTTTVKLGTIL